ncbi:MAG: hypothetical protein ACJ8EF_01555, partial [Bradyrhizobium sp.]
RMSLRSCGLHRPNSSLRGAKRRSNPHFLPLCGLLRFARKDGDGAACAFINPLLTKRSKRSPDEQSDIRDSSTPHVAALIRATPSKTRHCEAQSDEAIHTFFRSMDCFASLAKTVMERRAPSIIHY